MIRICYTYGTIGQVSQHREIGFIEVPDVGDGRHILAACAAMGELRQIQRLLDGDFRVGLATTMQGARAYLAMYRPDLLLLDARLFECEGHAAAAQTRGGLSDLNVPVVLLVSDDALPADFPAVHAQGFLRWPNCADRFPEAVRLMIRRTSER